MNRRILMVLAVAAAVAGCSHSSTTTSARAPLTEAQRDTVIAHSILPGADVVDRAMRVAGQEQRRAVRMDSLVP